MPSYSIPDPQGGAWAFSPDGVYLIVRGALRTRMILRRSRTVETTTAWYLPTLYGVETDWNGFRGALDMEARRYWVEAEMQLRHSPRAFYGTLVGLANAAMADAATYRCMVASASQRSGENVRSNVQNWEIAYEVTRLIRDGSATFLIATSSIVTGGAGAAAAGAVGMTGISTGTAMGALTLGSLMRGGFTYQDTGSVGAATVNAAGSFMIGSMSIAGAGASLTSGQAATLVIAGSVASGAAAGGQAIVEGKSMRDAAILAGVGAVGSGLGAVIGAKIETRGFVVQAATGTVLDLTSARVGERLTDPPLSSAPPVQRGAIDFTGLPARMAEDYVRLTAMRPI